ncbi:hypothetical protein C8R46DRAFT_1362548 [Mycena filopes]|nr:hypothetical protein C8R46DRAFT_1362548 [Mycena filopes]
MSLLDSIRARRPLRKVQIEHDASVPVLSGTLEISDKYDAIVLQANIENWGSILADYTPRTLMVPLTLEHGSLLLRAYEKLDHAAAADVVAAAAAAYVTTGKTSAPLDPLEAALLESLGPSIQRAIDELGASEAAGCFMKLSSRSPKDAAARSGVFEAYYERAVRAAPREVDDEGKLWILCAAEGAALRFADAAAVVRALVLSERVWQVTL